jgi:hypothetical protein
MKERTLFDILNSIFLKTGMDYEKRIASSYIISLWLSHDRELVEMVNDINHLQFNLDDEMIYKYYYYKVPKGKRFIRWPKKTEKDKKREEEINELCIEHDISKKEAEKYVR